MKMTAKAQLLNGMGRTLPLEYQSVLRGWQPGPRLAPALAQPMSLAPPMISMGDAKLTNCD